MGWLLALFPGRLFGYLAIAGVIFAMGGTAAYKVQAWRITNIKAAHAVALADAKERVNAAEKANLERITKAQNENTKLRQTNIANAAVAKSELGRLRVAINAVPAKEPQAASVQRADTNGELLAVCSQEITELARSCDGHVADKVMILQAWPQ